MPSLTMNAYAARVMSQARLTDNNRAGLLGLLCSVTVTCQQVDPSLTGQALLNMQTGPRRPPDFEEVMVSSLLQANVG